jgi:septum formation protein
MRFLLPPARRVAILRRVLYLASRSPQRAMLLNRATVVFAVVPSACREEDIDLPVPQALAVERARAKARAAQGVPAGGIALGADTVVALGRDVLGNPVDAAGVAAMLARLSGTTHQVLTGHCLARLAADGTVEAEAVALTTARVTMRPLSEAEIADYAASGEGIGKAGGYAIQERADRFVVDVQGSVDTVVGLHPPTVARLWREVGDGPLPGYSGPNPTGLQRALR